MIHHDQIFEYVVHIFQIKKSNFLRKVTFFNSKIFTIKKPVIWLVNVWMKQEYAFFMLHWMGATAYSTTFKMELITQSNSREALVVSAIIICKNKIYQVFFSLFFIWNFIFSKSIFSKFFKTKLCLVFPKVSFCSSTKFQYK